MYGSVENLIEDLTRSPPSDSDSDENGGTTQAISCVPTNVKRPGNFNKNPSYLKTSLNTWYASAEAQSNQQSNEPAGESVPAVSTGKIF